MQASLKMGIIGHFDGEGFINLNDYFKFPLPSVSDILGGGKAFFSENSRHFFKNFSQRGCVEEVEPSNLVKSNNSLTLQKSTFPRVD